MFMLYILQVFNESLMPVDQPMKLTMLMLLVPLLLSYGIGSGRCSTVPDNSTDLHALLDFKNAITNDPTGVTSIFGMIVFRTVSGRASHVARGTQVESPHLTSPAWLVRPNCRFYRKPDFLANP